MALVDAHLRASHPCAYQEVSDEAPDSAMFRWFDHGRNVLLLSNRTARGLRGLLDLVREVFGATCLAQEEFEALALVPDLGWTDPRSIEGLAGRSGVWIVPPIVIQGGCESCWVVARGRGELRAFTTRLRRTGPVELLSVGSRAELRAFRDLPFASAYLAGGMTNAQARSLVTAWDAGLFDVPSRARWETVSKSVGLSRSTFGEHLRKGQRRLLETSMTALRARVARVPEPVLLPPIRSESRRGKSPLRGVREEAN